MTGSERPPTPVAGSADRRRTTSRLLSCGLPAGPLFVTAFLIQGAFKGEGYDPVRHPVSSLALGDHGWAQTANFLVCGLLTIAFATGLWRTGVRAGAVLTGMWGLGLVGAGVFVTDPVSGFPVGTPPAVDYTTIGALHDGFSLPAFVALAAAQVVLSGGHGRTWRGYSLLSAIAFAATFVLAGTGFDQNPSLVDVAGLFQRLCVTIGWAWIFTLALRTLRRT
ncbi:DUF998 domain-containing protein [Kribbella swartbergensis]